MNKGGFYVPPLNNMPNAFCRVILRTLNLKFIGYFTRKEEAFEVERCFVCRISSKMARV